jgi:hypothetical protein
MAAKHNIHIDQGTTFAHNFVVKDSSATVIDLSGYTGRGQLRKEYASSSADADFTVTISAPTTGTVEVTLTAAQTELIDSGSYVYDIEIVNGATVHRIVQGNATVYPEVTRASSSSSGA